MPANKATLVNGDGSAFYLSPTVLTLCSMWISSTVYLGLEVSTVVTCGLSHFTRAFPCKKKITGYRL